MCTFILIFIFKWIFSFIFVFIITFNFLFKFIYLFFDAHIRLNLFLWCILLNICSIILLSFFRRFWKSRMWCWRTDLCKSKTVNMHIRKFTLCKFKSRNAIFKSENGIYDGLDWNGMVWDRGWGCKIKIGVKIKMKVSWWRKDLEKM